MSIRTTVYDQVKIVAEEQGKRLPLLTDEVRLMEAGLDSLCIAILIANLDDILQLAPFDDDNAEIPVTLGDLIGIYERASVNAAA